MKISKTRSSRFCSVFLFGALLLCSDYKRSKAYIHKTEDILCIVDFVNLKKIIIIIDTESTGIAAAHSTAPFVFAQPPTPEKKIKLKKSEKMYMMEMKITDYMVT